MLKTLQNAFKIKEVREKLLYTFFMLVVTRIGSQLPIPGVNTTFFQELFTRQSNDAFGFFNTITGGSFTNMSVFARTEERRLRNIRVTLRLHWR